jgi:inner membrane protein
MLPDADMLYFHFVDSGKVHHHDYMTHWPLFWLACAAVIIPIVRYLSTSGAYAAGALFAGTFLHMVLDTIASPVNWLMPLGHLPIELVVVPAIHSHWIISFILHWTFLLEVTICLAALWLWWRRDRFSRHASKQA